MAVCGIPSEKRGQETILTICDQRPTFDRISSATSILGQSSFNYDGDTNRVLSVARPGNLTSSFTYDEKDTWASLALWLIYRCSVTKF